MTAPSPSLAGASEADRVRDELADSIATAFLDGGATSPRRLAWLLVTGPLAPILADLAALRTRAEAAEKLIEAAQPGADRMEQAAQWGDPDGGLKSAVFGLATAARRARLNEKGTEFVLSHLLRTVKLVEAAEARVAQLEAALKQISDWCPATCEMALAHDMADTAARALNPDGETSHDAS